MPRTQAQNDQVTANRYGQKPIKRWTSAEIMAIFLTFCTACGLKTDPNSQVCPSCNEALDILRGEPVISVTTGYWGRGRKAFKVLVAEDAGHVSRYDEFGNVLPAEALAKSSLEIVNGVSGATRQAALLACCDSEFGFISSDPKLSESIIEHEIPSSEESRRTADSLARIGVAKPIALLPHLTDNERYWWMSIAYVCRGELERSVECLATTSHDYDLAVATAVWLGSLEPAPSGIGEFLANRLPILQSERVARLNKISQSDFPLANWFESTDRKSQIVPLTGGLADNAIRLLHVLSGGSVSGNRVTIPEGTSSAVIDDAIERGCSIDLDEWADTSEADAAYMVARTEPWNLTSEQVEILGFSSEAVRRALISMRPGDSIIQTDDARFESLMMFASAGELTSPLEEISPNIFEHFRRFKADPCESNLTAELVSDPTIWRILASEIDESALGWNPPRGSRAAQFLGWYGIHRTFECLTDAKYAEAINSAKHALRLGTTEADRDEALNLLACAHWMVGNDDGAKAALLDAIEGSRNPSLQVNLSVVSASDDPETAALELARLVSESDSPQLRMAAALKAVTMWASDETPWSNQDEEDVMPETLRDALRLVIVECEDSEHFRPLAKLAANHDGEWISDSDSLSGSVWEGSDEAELFSARARDLDEFVDVMTNLLKSPDCPAWVEDERDLLIDAIIASGFQDINDNATFFGFLAIEKGLPVTPRQRAVLVPMGILSLVSMFQDQEDDDNQAPNDRFTTMLENEERAAKSSGEYEENALLYEIAWRRLGFVMIRFLANQLDPIIDASNRISNQIAGIPRHRIDRNVVNDAYRSVLKIAREIHSDSEKWEERVAFDEDLLGYAVSVRNESNRIINHVQGLMR